MHDTVVRAPLPKRKFSMLQKYHKAVDEATERHLFFNLKCITILLV